MAQGNILYGVRYQHSRHIKHETYRRVTHGISNIEKVFEHTCVPKKLRFMIRRALWTDKEATSATDCPSDDPQNVLYLSPKLKGKTEYPCITLQHPFYLNPTKKFCKDCYGMNDFII
jgi:hypothetical protein